MARDEWLDNEYPLRSKWNIAKVHSAVLKNGFEKQGRKLERSSQDGLLSYRFCSKSWYHPRRTKSLKNQFMTSLITQRSLVQIQPPQPIELTTCMLLPASHKGQSGTDNESHPRLGGSFHASCESCRPAPPRKGSDWAAPGRPANRYSETGQWRAMNRW